MGVFIVTGEMVRNAHRVVESTNEGGDVIFADDVSVEGC